MTVTLTAMSERRGPRSRKRVFAARAARMHETLKRARLEQQSVDRTANPTPSTSAPARPTGDPENPVPLTTSTARPTGDPENPVPSTTSTVCTAGDTDSSVPSTSASVQQLPSTMPLALEEEISQAECETGYESESENERPMENSEGSNTEECDFDDDAVQNCFDDFMVSLPSLTRKTLSVSLMHYFQTRQGMNVKDSAQEAAYITGFNEKTIRTYW